MALLPVYVYDEVARKAGSLNAAMAIKQARNLYQDAPVASERVQQWDPSLVSVGLLSNARAGQAATPLSGYVFVAPGKASVPNGLFSASAMFKGRVMSPLLDIENTEVKRALREKGGIDAERVLDRLREKVKSVDMPRLLTETVREAYQKVGAGSLVTDSSDALVPLAPSEDALGIPPMFSIVRASNSNALYLVFEAHCSLNGGNAPLEQALYEAASNKERSLGDLFWDRSSEFVTLSKRYRATQIAWRTYVLRRMRAKIVEAMFGAEAASKLKLAPTATFDARTYNMSEAETTYKELHFLTNEDDIVNDDANKNQFFVFFSEAQRAAEGALVMGGPFRHGLWIGAEASILQNRFNGSVPFSVPFGHRKPQNEILNEVARAIVSVESGSSPSSSSENVLMPEIKTDGTGAGVYLARDEELDSELVWPRSKLSSGVQRLLHRQCYETWYDDKGQTSDELMDAYGVDMRLAKVNRTMRPIVTVLSAVDNPMIDLVTTRLYMSIIRIETANASLEDAPAHDDNGDHPPPLVPSPNEEEEPPAATDNQAPLASSDTNEEEEEVEEEEQTAPTVASSKRYIASLHS